MNRFPTYIPTYTREEDTLVNPASPLYICVSPPIDENKRGAGVGLSSRRSISDSSSTRLCPPPRSRYHSWYSGSPLTGRNTSDSYRLSSVPDEDSSDFMYRSTSLSPSTSRGTRYRPTSFSPYGLKDLHTDHYVQRLRYINSAPTSPSDLPISSRKIQERFPQCQKFHDFLLFPDGFLFPSRTDRCMITSIQLFCTTTPTVTIPLPASGISAAEPGESQQVSGEDLREENSELYHVMSRKRYLHCSE